MSQMTQMKAGPPNERAAGICGHLRHLWMILRLRPAFSISFARLNSTARVD